VRGDLDGAAWDALLKRALRREPAQRYQTAREMADALAIILRAAAPGERELSDLAAKVADDLRLRAVRDEMPTVPAAEFVDTAPSARG
jgi:hypothetical protein